MTSPLLIARLLVQTRRSAEGCGLAGVAIEGIHRVDR
jgi:hypothetical protein